MADKRSSITAQIRADASGWKKGCDMARAETKRFKKDVESTKVNMPEPSGIGKWTEMASKANIAGMLYEGVKKVGGMAVDAKVWADDLRDSIIMMGYTAEESAYKFEELLQVANQMSLSDIDVETLVKWQIQLESVGYKSDQATGMIRELVNAAEGMGVGIETLNPMVAAFDKMTQNGEATKKQIMAITSETKQLRPIMQAAFGTSVAADIEKLGLSGEQMIDRLMIGLRTMKTQGPSDIEKLSAKTGQTKQAALAIGRGTATLPGLEARKELSEEEAKASLRESLNAANKKDVLRIEQEITDERKRQIGIIDEALFASKQEYNTAYERLKSADFVGEAKRKEIAAQEMLNKMKKDDAKISGDIANAVRRAADAMIDNENAASRMDALKGKLDEREQRKIDEMRQVGRDRKADKMEDALKAKKMQEEGLSKRDAEEFVREERAASRNEALGKGRRMIGQKKQDYKPFVREYAKGMQVPVAQNRMEVMAATQEKLSQERGITAGDAATIISKLNEISNNTKPLPSAVQSGVRK